MNERKTIDLEQGWEFMQKGITKLKNILEGLPEPQFSSEDYMMLYTSFSISVSDYVSNVGVRKGTIYNMCTQKPPHDYSQQLYDKYRESFEEYITSTCRKLCFLDLGVSAGYGMYLARIWSTYQLLTLCYLDLSVSFGYACVPNMGMVLPSLREKHDEFMLRELVKRWSNHKVMVRWLSRFFHYLDRYFIARRSLPPLNEVGLTCFRELSNIGILYARNKKPDQISRFTWLNRNWWSV
ncbi:hypothetical protein Gogos_012929 [Gossypium gossypioides]|uniref:Cullin N-terminal domain-containing protein n=1 Tax=Gossypium gossypioides TaxID=34282 RepID=A0A7J9BU14_GOSGO|nr:hypothetical protein [Gossypium gossypioides]